MFIYAIKANTLKFFGVIGLAVLSLAVVVFCIPEYTPVTTGSIAVAMSKYNFDKIKTSSDAVEFLEQFGWELETTPVEEVTLKIPAEFDKVMNSYNELQKKQGLDLSKYRGKQVVRYTYKITNYPEYTGTVFANVIVYKNRVVGGDVCSSDVTGFIGGFEYPDVGQ